MAKLSYRAAVSPESACTLVKGRTQQTRFRYIQAQSEYEAELQLQMGMIPVPEGVEYKTCNGCDVCVPARVNLATFEAAGWQRNVQDLNRDLVIKSYQHLPDVQLERDHLYLLKAYMESEHRERNYHAFREMHYYNFYRGFHVRRFDARDGEGRLQASMITHGAGKSVFGTKFFYNPQRKESRIGNFIMLETMLRLKAQGYSHLYFGDVAGHGNKYTWKLFLPIETFDGNQWSPRQKREAAPKPSL